MTKPVLFLDAEYKLSFEKIAMPVKLSDSPEAWQREIASEIFKQLPYLGDYAVNVIVDRVDGERGYAFGSAEITNKTDAPTPQQQELPKVRIPLIVKERLLLPMDVFMDGKGVYPLTASRLRERLFRSDTFEMSTRKPTDKGMIDNLYPPSRSSSQGGTGGAMDKMANAAEQGRKQMVAMQKAQAAANPGEYVGKYAGEGEKPLLLEAIAPTISEGDADTFVSELSDNMALKVAAARNRTFYKLAMTIAAAPTKSAEKTAHALVANILPTVVQFQKLASGEVLVKWANAAAFAPQQDVVSPEAAAQMSGGQTAAPEAPATITVGTEKAMKGSLKEEGYIQISESGTYKVQNADSSEEMFGTIMPVIDFEMMPLEMFVFASAAAYAVQDEIAGIRQLDQQPELPTVPAQEAQGNGVLIYDISGKMHCLLPMTVQNMAQGPDGTMQIHAEDMFGEPVILSIAPGLEGISQIGEQEYAIPDFLQWLPLQNLTTLAKTPEEIEAVQAQQQAPSTVDVGSTGQGEFHMEGAPVEKIARDQRSFMKRAEAEFLLVGMGVTPAAAKDFLKQAEKRGKVKVAGVRTIVPLTELHAEALEKAAATLAEFPYHLKKNLVKEASTLDDSETADKVLAMNFLNPDNVSMFASYLPELDKAACKLAEMLVGARMGLSEVDEGAVERSMKNLESTIEGLKALQQKEMV